MHCVNWEAPANSVEKDRQRAGQSSAKTPQGRLLWHSKMRVSIIHFGNPSSSSVRRIMIQIRNTNSINNSSVPPCVLGTRMSYTLIIDSSNPPTGEFKRSKSVSEAPVVSSVFLYLDPFWCVSVAQLWSRYVFIQSFLHSINIYLT